MLSLGDRKALIDTFQFDNGITVYQDYESSAELTKVRILIPFGWLSAHSPLGVLRFFPHVLTKRSKSSPEENQFLRSLARFNGTFKVKTGYKFLEIIGSLPNPNLGETEEDRTYLLNLQNTLCEHLFEPYIAEEDLPVIKDKLKHQRTRAWTYYPEHSEEEYLTSAHWMNDGPDLFMFQYGESEEQAIENITPEMLHICHTHVFRSDIQVVCTGGDASQVLSYLEGMETHNAPTSSITRTLTWHNPTFRYTSLRTEINDMYNLWFGALLPEFKTPKRSILRDVFVFLLDSIIFRKYREEKQLIYSWEVNNIQRDVGLGLEVKLPLSSFEDVDYVRKDLPKEIEQAIDDEDYLNKVVNKKYNERIYLLDTPQSKADSFMNDLISFGEIISEERKYIEILEHARDPHVMQEFWAAMKTGAICFPSTAHT